MGRTTAEGIVGKYKGVKVYRVSLPEYVNGRLYKDEDNMYLIDGELIYKNEIFAKCDGKYVEEYDPHERAIYYTVPRFGAGTDPIKIEDRGVEFSSSIGTADGDSVSKNEMKTEDAIASSSSSSNFEFKTVDEILVGSLGSEATNYFSGMTDAVACASALADVFLKSALES